MGNKKPKYRLLRARILSDLEKNLDRKLTYHGVEHTLDVCNSCNAYIRRLSLTPKQRLLLRTAALLHDYGFLKTYRNHERIACDFASNTLKDYGYTKREIESICEMILATKIPQSPKNKLSRILCDADLDYLGRSDFTKTGNALFQELKNYKILKTRLEWNNLQKEFLSAHKYKTKYGQKFREPIKQKHLKRIQSWLNKNSSK